MASPVSFPRAQLRLKFRAWAWQNKTVLTGVAGALVVVLGAVSAVMLLLGEPNAVTWYVLGAVHAGGVAAIAGLLYTMFLAHDPEAIRQLRGAWGEDATTDELGKAQRKKLVWGWVDGVGLERGDLDHFVVTRHAGLLVLDSKFSTSRDSTRTTDLAGQAARVQRRAEGVARSLVRSERRARHRGRSNPVAVRAAVVVWGPLQHEVPPDTCVDGIDVIPGRRLLDWLSRQEGQEVREESAYDLLVALRDFSSSTRRAASSGTPRAARR